MRDFCIRSASILQTVTEKCIEICYLKHTRKHIFAITFYVLLLWNLSSILPKNQSKQIVIIIRQKNEKHTWKSLKSFLSILTSACRSEMSLCHFHPKLLFPLFYSVFNSRYMYVLPLELFWILCGKLSKIKIRNVL